MKISFTFSKIAIVCNEHKMITSKGSCPLGYKDSGIREKKEPLTFSGSA